MLKTVEGALPWSTRTSWTFPEIDRDRLTKSFWNGPNDVDDAMSIVLELCDNRRTCIQAGGAVGIWPTRLAQLFDRVLTFEAEPVNFQCLEANTAEIANIQRRHAALGCNKYDSVQMRLDPGESQNPGAFYGVPGGDIPVVTIDSLGLSDVDLIYLDIEGAETDAFLGATNTISRCRPVIGLEDKRSAMWQRFGYSHSPVEMLIEDFGYTEVARVHLDVILKP